jgi:hypothetical protein
MSEQPALQAPAQGPSQPPQVSSDRVIEILTRDVMGAALWRAAIAEATVEAYQRRVTELEKAATPQS